MTANGSGHGTAGRRGDEIRSDLWVEIELNGAASLDIELSSRVEPYYGAAIRSQTAEVLGALGVRGARVAIEDKGALPFVIAARVEAAARRAGADGDARPAITVPDREPSAKNGLRRSRLYLPGGEPKYFINAGRYGPDAVILDLEDSVHPDEKDAARLLVRNALRTIDFLRAERMVRINQLPLGLEDLAAIVPERPELVLLPKTETVDQLREVDAAIDEIAGKNGRPIWLMPILESALGIENSFKIATASPRVAALTLGVEDYAADLGVPRSADGDECDYARRRLVNAAHAAGVQAIDSVFGQIDDLDGLARRAAQSRRLGFEGMGCLHPSQIPVIHEQFNPSEDQIRRAVRIVEAFRAAQAEGRGVVSLGSKMIDPPVVDQARTTVERATALGLLPGDDDETGIG